MDALTIAAASGMRSRMETLDMLANNLANASTNGFKSDREFYSTYVSAEAEAAAGDGSQPTTVPVVEKQFTDFTQGLLTATGNPLDLAIPATDSSLPKARPARSTRAMATSGFRPRAR